MWKTYLNKRRKKEIIIDHPYEVIYYTMATKITNLCLQRVSSRKMVYRTCFWNVGCVVYVRKTNFRTRCIQLLHNWLLSIPN